MEPIRKVRPDHALEDFEAMCTDRHHDLVRPAMLQMMTLVAEISHGDPTQALALLLAFREVAMSEGEESLYNRFLLDLMN